MNYTDENIILNILDNGNWELTLDGILYLLQWFGSFMKVSGGDICYWLYEVENQLRMSGCSLQEVSMMIS